MNSCRKTCFLGTRSPSDRDRRFRVFRSLTDCPLELHLDVALDGGNRARVLVETNFVEQRLRGGGKTYHVNLGGGNVLQSVLSKPTFGGLEIGVGLVGASFF